VIESLEKVHFEAAHRSKDGFSEAPNARDFNRAVSICKGLDMGFNHAAAVRTAVSEIIDKLDHGIMRLLRRAASWQLDMMNRLGNIGSRVHAHS